MPQALTYAYSAASRNGSSTVKTAPPLSRLLAADLAAEHVHEVPHDGQSEAGAAGSRARLVDAIEALEHAAQILGRNARARCPRRSADSGPHADRP